jgi:acyl-CoA thioesterase-1
MSRLIIYLLLTLIGPCSLPVQAAAGTNNAPVILVYGDSLSAGYGLRVEQGWVSLLSRRLEQTGYEFRVVNASVSGETSAGGLARLPRALATHRPGVVVLELGANDGLRALPAAEMRANLDRMLTLARDAGSKVLLVGIHMPPNYGPRYTTEFDRIYRELAARHRVPLVPFLLQAVADKNELMQADGLHPNERGQPILLDNVWTGLKPLLGRAARRS